MRPGKWECVPIHGVASVDGGLTGALRPWAAEEMGGHAGHRGQYLDQVPVQPVAPGVAAAPAGSGPGSPAIGPSRPLSPLLDAVGWTASNIKRWLVPGEQDTNRAISSITM